MYEAHFGLRERPFSLLPDPAFLFPSKRHAMALTMLEYALETQAGITLVTGDIGMGKTTLVRRLLNQMGEAVAVGLINNTHRAFGGLLQWVNLAFSLPHDGLDDVALFRRFQDFMVEQYAHGRRTVLIIDEAQNLDATALEEVRVLSNINADKDQVLQLILVGQPELRQTLRRPELEQFVQRIAVDYHLSPLAPEETDEYIAHRLHVAGGAPGLIDRFARRFIHYQAGGVPRIINTLCDMALVYAYAEQRAGVDLDTVEAVVRDKVDAGLFGAGKALRENGASFAEVQSAQLRKSLEQVREDLTGGAPLGQARAE